MSQIKTEIGTIAYNPALETFEALVTFHTLAGPQRVAASFRAPLSAEFEVISDGLLRDALGNFAKSGVLKSRLRSVPAKPAPAYKSAEPLAA